MLKEGTIVPSQSPYASPVVFCRKNNGLPPDKPKAYRFAVDCRKLKYITKFPRYSLPLIDDLITNIPYTTVTPSLNHKSRSGSKSRAEPVVFASRKLSSAERNYTVTERECLAVVWALNKFRTYLGSPPIKVITDHAALTRLTDVKLISDNGLQFMSDIFEHLSVRLGIRHVKTVVYRPQANRIERVNRDLMQMIANYVNYHHDTWNQFLREFAYAIRTALNETTGETPAELFLGRTLITLFQKLVIVLDGTEFAVGDDEVRPNTKAKNKKWAKYYDGRRFVEWAQNEIAVVPDFHKRILFSDEAHFWLNGYVNKQNCRVWSEANPQVHVETPFHPEKLTVWCALRAGGIITQKRWPQRYSQW
ncbi:transposon Ty3-I Gag-Pol polyprotein [Trichonephila clavipes]|nr:transposon Ty3-I Gag-Pol polyprotein [Trichonephila clavipes]